MNLYDEIIIFDWFRIHYIENPGMAFGLELGGEYGKLFLSLFRIFIVVWGVFYIKRMITESNFSNGNLICFGLIIGGAIGNIVDSTFYGVIFNEANIFYGSVVDMLYFPLFEVDLPKFLSFLEGSDNIFTFFAPRFNIADSSIFIGISCILIFYKNNFN